MTSLIVMKPRVYSCGARLTASNRRFIGMASPVSGNVLNDVFNTWAILTWRRVGDKASIWAREHIRADASLLRPSNDLNKYLTKHLIVA